MYSCYRPRIAAFGRSVRLSAVKKHQNSTGSVIVLCVILYLGCLNRCLNSLLWLCDCLCSVVLSHGALD